MSEQRTKIVYASVNLEFIFSSRLAAKPPRRGIACKLFDNLFETRRLFFNVAVLWLGYLASIETNRSSRTSCDRFRVSE